MNYEITIPIDRTGLAEIADDAQSITLVKNDTMVWLAFHPTGWDVVSPTNRQ